MQQLVSEVTRPVVLSDHALRQLARLKEAHQDIQRQTGQEPTLSQLAARTGLQRDQLANLIAVERPPRALEEPRESAEGAIGTFGELLVDPLAEDEYERVVTHVAASQLRDVLSGRTPKIFERGELYAIAAAFGAAMFLLCDALKLPREISTIAGSLCGFGLRLLALRYHWQTRSIRTE